VPTNLERMIRLADEVFDTKNDPAQIAVSESTIPRLQAIHPATVSGEETPDGPVAWILLIPTTLEVMEQFLKKEITEQQLLDRTLPGQTYQAIYLCSALVLPEARRRGLARRLVVDAIAAIRRDHPITDLYFWPFSKGGDALATVVANEVGLPLHRRAA